MTARPLHHQRPLAAFALAYGMGVWAGVRFSFYPALTVCGLGLGLCTVLLLRRVGKRPLVGAMACALFLGMLLSGYASHPVLPPEEKYQVTGVAAQDMTLREDGKAAGYLEQVRLEREGVSYSLARAYWTYTPEEEAPLLPREGESVTFLGKIYHPKGQENPYGFDFRLFLLQQGASLGISGAAQPQLLGHPGRGLASVLYGARRALTERLRQVYGQGSPLPEALLLGVREQLPEETVQGFSDAGVAHILSVSGLHVALLAGALMLPLKRLLSPGQRLLVLGLFLGLYCALLDFSAPVVRASLLLLLGEVRQRVRRAADPVTTLSAAFLVILLARPLDLFSASFQLSFGAVLGMGVLGTELTRLLSRLRLGRLPRSVALTLSATAGTVLPVIQVFHRLPLLGLVVSPVLCALFGLLLPLYALLLGLGFLWLPGAQLLAGPVNWVTGLVVDGVEFLGGLPFATVNLPFLPWYCLLAFIGCAFLATRFSLLSKGWKLAAGFLLLTLSFGTWHLTLCRDVQYIQLAMGQADAALILDGRDTTLIDAGSYGGDAASYLLSTGRRADRVILTHLHADHCLGLTQLLEKKVPIGAVYLPLGGEKQQVDAACLSLLEEIRARSIPVYYLAAGDELTTDRVHIAVQWPRADSLRLGRKANEGCLALKCDLDGVSLFTAGDLSGLYEMYPAQDADILKVSHHGSKTSTSTAFLEIVSPRLALLTGATGSSVLPSQNTLDRLAQIGIPAYNTAEWGALTVTIQKGNIILTPYLPERRGP